MRSEIKLSMQAGNGISTKPARNAHKPGRARKITGKLFSVTASVRHSSSRAFLKTPCYILHPHSSPPRTPSTSPPASPEPQPPLSFPSPAELPPSRPEHTVRRSPISCGRSSRLAAQNTPYDDPQSPVGEAQPTHTSKQGAGFIHHERQNLPDPRRSSRLAALNTPYDDPQSPVGEVQPTHTSKQGAGFIHHESQNLPDPRCPPPSAAHFQNHFDLKIGDGGSGGAGERFHISQPSSNGGLVFGTGVGANEAGPAGGLVFGTRAGANEAGPAGGLVFGTGAGGNEAGPAGGFVFGTGVGANEAGPASRRSCVWHPCPAVTLIRHPTLHWCLMCFAGGFVFGSGVGATEAGPAGGFVFGTGAGANEAGPAGDEAVSRILALLSPIYEAVRHLSNFRSAEAIKELRVMAKTSPFQYRTALVQCLLGRAHFENMDYDVAASSFEVARSADRFRVEGMDLYSTVLWHLKRDYDLSYLAQEMIALDRHAPQTWCVLGNFFSLQKEHESAVEFFQRALQLDGTHVYAYTLCGHEYLANEDFEKAATCYRNATRLDNRHYNAVYGMGQIYFRQEKYEMALVLFKLKDEKYEMALVQFKSAANINARSSVLHTYVGITMHKQGMHERALVKLKEAIELDRRNPLARYELSNVLSSLERPDAALKELQQLNSIAPGEASVFIQMGKLYKRLGDLKKAQHHLEMALSFSTSSSDAGLIKASIEKLGVDEDEEDEEM
eukprot:gene18281-24737_t